jgi:PAS domain S-box-containing protein
MSAHLDPHLQQDSAYRAIFEASSDGLVINDAETGIVLDANPAFCHMHGYERMDGLHPSTFVHPNSRHLFGEYVEAIRNGQEYRTRAQDVRRDGSVFDVEVLGRGFMYQGRPAMIGVVRDMTEHVRAFHDLEQLVGARTREIEQRRQVAEALRSLLAMVNSTHTLGELLQEVVSQASRLLGSDASAIYLSDSSGPEMTLRSCATSGVDPARADVSVPTSTSATGSAFSHRRPVSIDDVRNAPPGDENAARLAAAGYLAMLAVPLVVKDEVYGALTLYFLDPREFAADQVELAIAFASQAALAIENARLHEQSEQRRDELEALYHADQALHRSLRTEEVLDVLIDLPVKLGQAEMVSMLLWDEQQHRFRVGPVRGLSDTILRETFSLAEARIPHGQHGGIVEVEDAVTDTRMSNRLRETITREGVRAWISSPIRISGRLFGSFSFGYQHPHHFTDRERQLLVALAQRAALALQNARMHEETEQQRRQLETLYSADAALHRSLRLKDVLEALVDTAMNLLQMDAAALWGPISSRGNQVGPLYTRGLSREYIEETMRIRHDASVMAFWWSRDMFALEDVLTDPSVPESQRAALLREGCRALFSTQIRIGEEVFGSFSMGWRKPHRFSPQEQQLLSALAQRAGLAIRNARLYEQSQQAAALEERQRLARELHDAVTQTLFSTALIAEVLPDLWDLDANEGRQRLSELRRLTRGALAEMRTLLVELRPGALSELPLGDLLRQLAEATAGRTRLDVSTSVEGSPRPLPTTVHVALYRVTQEALNNVVKHARAQEASIRLAYLPDGIRLRISDDGCGFEAQLESATPGHFGLGIMRERAESIAARFRLVSHPGTGTTIEITWNETEDAVA